MSNIIFTNNALRKIANRGLSESQVRDVFTKGRVERYKQGYTSVYKYSGYEVGVYWNRDSDGKYKIISAWKRSRR